METIQEIIDTIKTMAGHNMVGYGALFHYPRF